MDTMHREQLGQILTSFEAGALVAPTLMGDLHAHPVAVGRFGEDGALCLAGGIDATPMLEPERRDACMLICELRGRFLVLNGTMTLDLDPSRAHAEWLEHWWTWFRDGPSSLSLVLVRFAPRSGEYWDHTGVACVRTLVDAVPCFVNRAGRPSQEHFRIV